MQWKLRGQTIFLPTEYDVVWQYYQASRTLSCCQKSLAALLLSHHTFLLLPFESPETLLTWESIQGTNPWRKYFFISFQMRRQRFNSNAGGSSTGLPKGTENRTVSSLYISWAVLSSSNFSHCSSALSCTSPLWSTALLCALPVAGLTIVTAVFKEVWVIRISPGIRGRDCQLITSVF